MKVFDVAINEISLLHGGYKITVFAEDTAQASRIAIRAVNKRRQGTDTEFISSGPSFISLKPLEDLALEHITKVEVIRDQVAS